MANEKFVAALFENGESEKVKQCVEALLAQGIDKNDIAVISRVEDEEKIEDIETKKADRKALSWSEWGALSGGLLGLLIGGVIFTAPITGPVAAVGASFAGAINGLLGGAVVGGALFGVGDGLIEWGVAAEEAKRLEKAVEEGRLLLIVKTDETKLDEIEKVLRENGAENVEKL